MNLHGAAWVRRTNTPTPPPPLQVRLWQLGQLAPPSLSAHLEAHAVLPVLYATSWCEAARGGAARSDCVLGMPRSHRPHRAVAPAPFTHIHARRLLTCFAADFPLGFAARVMDLVLTESYAAPMMKARAQTALRLGACAPAPAAVWLQQPLHLLPSPLLQHCPPCAAPSLAPSHTHSPATP